MQLKSIDYQFPTNTEGAALITGDLLKLISFDPAARTAGCSVEAGVRGTDPTTKFTCREGEEPKLCFSGTALPDVPLRCDGTRARDWLRATPVNMCEVLGALEGHILWIDHTGLNAPAAHFGGAWEMFVRSLGDSSLLYSYPTGEPWFFVLPGTRQEHDAGITIFPPDRTPRFELVEMSPGASLAIQIDIQADLTRANLEEMFPFPKGVSLPGLEDYFRSVFIKHPWPGLEIRLDLRFGSGHAAGDWETGKWLVENGQRCNSRMRRIPRADSPRTP